MYWPHSDRSPTRTGTIKENTEKTEIKLFHSLLNIADNRTAQRSNLHSLKISGFN